MNKRPLITNEIRFEQDVVFVRQRARELARLLGFDGQEQTRIATAVSELARNAYQYAGGGLVEYAIGEERGASPVMLVTVRDSGPGVAALDEVLGGLYRSKTGMGLGLIGAKRLMDRFDIQTGRDGTTVTIGKTMPARAGAISGETIRRVLDDLVGSGQRTPFDELRQQNQELIGALAEIQRKQDELNEINRELEDTNRGVVALYRELDEKAEALGRANSVKTQFLSNMTHEFRTPLNAVLNLTRILLDRLDGPLTDGQEKQIRLIRRSAEGLAELVDDLLDIAKVEAGKIPVRADDFELAELFGSIRGLFRNWPALATASGVELIIEEPTGVPRLRTDEGKVAQVIRNFVSNALKYTERGHVRLSARMRDARIVEISVEDTGIGIAPEDQPRIFEEFVQVESARQRLHKGTGLGLALSRRLADLLDGTVTLASEPGRGSTFSLLIPVHYQGPAEGEYIAGRRAVDAPFPAPAAVPPPAPVALTRAPIAPAAGPARVLLIDDREEERYFVRSVLGSRFACSVLEASGGSEGLRVAARERPRLIFLDLVMPDASGFDVLSELRREPALAGVPIVIFTGKILSPAELERLREATGILSKSDLDEEVLIREIMRIGRAAGLPERAAGESAAESDRAADGA